MDRLTPRDSRGTSEGGPPATAESSIGARITARRARPPFTRLFVAALALVGLATVFLAATYPLLGRTRPASTPPPPHGFTLPDGTRHVPAVYFIALGDQGEGGSTQQQVAHLMNDKARNDSLHFVLTLGDNFYPDGVTAIHDPQWKVKFEDMYDLPFLNVPFYASLGNHDHHGNVASQVAYGATNEKWVMPDYFYTFTKSIAGQTQIQFFALDTDVIVRGGQHERQQLEWLRCELEASQATWKIVYGHHPVFSYGSHGSEKRMIDRVQPLLKRFGVDLYVSGHDHDRQFLGPVGGVHYVVSGTGSKSRKVGRGEMTRFAGSDLGFAWFRVSSDEIRMEFIDQNGNREFAHSWKKNVSSGLGHEAAGAVARAAR